jgi:hypothetical protein
MAQHGHSVSPVAPLVDLVGKFGTRLNLIKMIRSKLPELADSEAVIQRLTHAPFGLRCYWSRRSERLKPRPSLLLCFATLHPQCFIPHVRMPSSPPMRALSHIFSVQLMIFVLGNEDASEDGPAHVSQFERYVPPPLAGG